MRVREAIVVFAILGVRIAVADPLSVTVGGGLSSATVPCPRTGCDVVLDGQSHWSVEMTVGYRARWLSVGAHIATSGSSSSGRTVGGDIILDEHQYQFLPVDAGLAVQFERDRLWVAPWIGRTFLRFDNTHTIIQVQATPPSETVTHTRVWEDDSTTIGLMAGFDVLVRDSNRFSVFVSAQTGIGDYNETTTFSITTFCIGIAYRHAEPVARGVH